MRRVGEKMEVNSQLISTETGAHVWADRFEGERSKIGELQVDIVSRLARSLGVELVKAEALRSMRERPNNPDAADLAMRASARFNSSGDSKSINSDVIDLSERALALDPQNERAMVDLSGALTDRVTNQWSDDPAGDLARAEKVADSALALQPDDASAHMAKAQVFFDKQQWRAAISQAEAALADDPNYADAHANLSFWNVFLGHSEDGFAGLETALRLSPRDPNVSWWQFYMCHAHTHLAQWEQAIEWCGKSIASGNQSMYPFVDLTAAYAWTGHDKEAKETVAQLRKLYPDFTVQTWAGIHWTDDPTFNAQYARIVEGLRKAGLPEGEEEDGLKGLAEVSTASHHPFQRREHQLQILWTRQAVIAVLDQRQRRGIAAEALHERERVRKRHVFVSHALQHGGWRASANHAAEQKVFSPVLDEVAGEAIGLARIGGRPVATPLAP